MTPTERRASRALDTIVVRLEDRPNLLLRVWLRLRKRRLESAIVPRTQP